MKSRQASAACTSTCAVAAASRAPWAASPGRSSVLDGMQAQYEHSPPTSSRSTTATRSPRAASAAAQCSPGAPPPRTIASNLLLEPIVTSVDSWPRHGRGRPLTPTGLRSRRHTRRLAPATALPGLGDSPGGVDQANMAESLREVADHLTGAGVDLLSKQADVVDGGHRPLEGRSGCPDVTGERLRLRQPECAQQERPFITWQS